MKTTILNIFKMYAKREINDNTFLSLLQNIEDDLNTQLMFRISNTACLWSVNDLSSTIYGYNRNNKQFLSESIETLLKYENNLEVLG